MGIKYFEFGGLLVIYFLLKKGVLSNEFDYLNILYYFGSVLDFGI